MAHDALVKAKTRRAAYYDRGARERGHHCPSVTLVYTRWNDGEGGRKANFTEVLPHRSYNVQLEDGTVRRRKSKHVRFSREPPLILRYEIDNTSRPQLGGPPAAIDGDITDTTNARKGTSNEMHKPSMNATRYGRPNSTTTSVLLK